MGARRDERYRLIQEAVIVYEGFEGTASMAHARAYEAAGEGVVVIVGELSDNPGMSVTASIESLAATIELTWFFGDRPFRLLEYDVEEQTFSEVTFTGEEQRLTPSPAQRLVRRVTISADGRRLEIEPMGVLQPRFQGPHWRFASILDVLGVMPELFNPEEYTVARRGGDEAERFRKQVVLLQGERLTAMGAVTRGNEEGCA